mgnify:CR=1 FL=1
MKRPPDISINRLAIYLRFLDDYQAEKGLNAKINSEELARFLDMNPHQIRKDLSYFGRFGERGVGYRVKELRERIGQILGLNRKWNLCICGAGNLGSALCAYRGFRQMNLNIVALFDTDPNKIGRRIKGIKVFSPADIKKIVRKLHIDIAIIAVPLDSAQEIANKLIISGIRAILNFAPIKISCPRQVKLGNVDLSTALINLTYFLNHPW